MGEVVPIHTAPVTQAASNFVELAQMTQVGAVRVVAACESGCERTGPYKIVFRAEGVPDRCLVTMTADPAFSHDLMKCLKDYAWALGWALRYAADYPGLLDGVPLMPEGAA